MSGLPSSACSKSFGRLSLSQWSASGAATNRHTRLLSRKLIGATSSLELLAVATALGLRRPNIGELLRITFLASSTSKRAPTYPMRIGTPTPKLLLDLQN